MTKIDALQKVSANIGIFDREYCSLMKDCDHYKKLMPEGEDWATYRDLEKVFADPKMQQKGFNATNTLLIDSEAEKVQLWRENSLVVEPFTKEDVCLLPNLHSENGEVRLDQWQKNYMMEIRDYVIHLLDNA